jgi:hypothetical protein
MTDSPTGDTPENEPAEQSSGSASGTTPRRTQMIIAVGIVLVLVIVAVGVILARSSGTSDNAQGSSTTKAAACGGGDWPAAIKGKPSAMAKATSAGFYAWSDATGFHLRGSDPNGTTPFAGKVTASAGIINGSVKVQPAGAAVKTEVTGNTLTFSFDATKTVSGLDFSICGSTQASVSVTSNSALWPIDHFYTGTKGRAVSNPLILARG